MVWPEMTDAGSKEIVSPQTYMHCMSLSTTSNTICKYSTCNIFRANLAKHQSLNNYPCNDMDTDLYWGGGGGGN